MVVIDQAADDLVRHEAILAGPGALFQIIRTTPPTRVRVCVSLCRLCCLCSSLPLGLIFHHAAEADVGYPQRWDEPIPIGTAGNAGESAPGAAPDRANRVIGSGGFIHQ